MRWFWVALGLVAGCLSAPVAGAEDNIEGLYRTFDQEFQKLTRENDIPGSAYAIIDGDHVLAVKTFGLQEKGGKDPVVRTTVFRLASVSKTFAADLAGVLMAEKKFSLDDPLLRYVPDLKFKDPGFAKQLQVRHILSHSAGLMPNAYDLMVEDGWTMDKIVPRFQQLKPMCKPGECYGYQNVLFSLIGPVIEQTTGADYGALVEERFFRPLGMKTASVGYEGFMQSADKAMPHILTRRGLIEGKPSPNYYTVAPAAGVNASIDDMSQWLIAQMGHRPEVLPAPVLSMVTTKQVQTRRELYKRQWKRHLTDAYYGLGWRLYEFPEGELVMHAGAVSGYRSLVSYSRDKDIGLVILMNADTRVIDELAAGFWTDALSGLPEVTAASR